jgi:hypothetical protein
VKRRNPPGWRWLLELGLATKVRAEVHLRRALREFARGHCEDPLARFHWRANGPE